MSNNTRTATCPKRIVNKAVDEVVRTLSLYGQRLSVKQTSTSDRSRTPPHTCDPAGWHAKALSNQHKRCGIITISATLTCARRSPLPVHTCTRDHANIHTSAGKQAITRALTGPWAWPGRARKICRPGRDPVFRA